MKQPEIDLVCEETYFRLRCFTTNRWTVFKVQRSDSHLDKMCVYLLNWFLISCNYSWIWVHLRISCETSNKSEATSSVCSMTNISTSVIAQQIHKHIFNIQMFHFNSKNTKPNMWHHYEGLWGSFMIMQHFSNEGN